MSLDAGAIGAHKPSVINLYGQYKPGRPNNGKDSVHNRLKYFRAGLEQIAALDDLQSIAFPHEYA